MSYQLQEDPPTVFPQSFVGDIPDPNGVIEAGMSAIYTANEGTPNEVNWIKTTASGNTKWLCGNTKNK
jgi:hypothetical protein